MNNIKKSLLAASMTFVLSACTFSSGYKLDWKDVKNKGTGISLVSPRVKNTSLSFDVDNFKKTMAYVDELAVNRGNVYTFTGEMRKVNNQFASLKEKVLISRAYYQAYGDEEYKKKYESLYEAYLSFYSWYYTFLLHVQSSSSDIYNSFFAGMNQEEVEEYIRGFLYTDETKKIDKEIEDIQNEQEEKYNQFVKDFRNKTIKVGDDAWNKYLNDSLNRFRQVIEKGNYYADIYGYDNYLDYVYDNYYNRNYTYSFVDEYASLIDQYVIPAVKYYEDNVDPDYLDNHTKKVLFNGFTTGNIADEDYFKGNLLDSYVAMMGGEMEKSYNHLKSNGYYVFSNDPNSLGTAYVSSGMDDPLIYFSKDYQNVSTIVHEFGHYNAAYSNPFNYSFPFDIEETHSQGNEMLFVRYLSDYYKDDSNFDVFKYIQDYSVYDMLLGCLLPTAVAKVETYIFENLDKSNDVLLAEINSIMATYRALYGEGYDLIYSYWAAPAVTSTGYYISYATSGVASVGIYIQAKKDFEQAKTNYLKFVAYPEESNDITSFFTYSGLYSPLKEETFKMFTHDNLYYF